jgi:hypothetical protein
VFLRLVGTIPSGAADELVLVLVREILERALVRLGDEEGGEDTGKHEQGKDLILSSKSWSGESECIVSLSLALP